MTARTPLPGNELDDLRREVETLRNRVVELETDALAYASPQSSPLFAGLLQLPLLFFRVGPDGHFRHVAGRAIERIGIDPDNLVGRSVLEIFPEAETELTESLAGNAVWSETSGTFQGRPWAALSYVTPLADGEGTIGVALDVTDWKIARRELAASELRFRTLAETVAVAISRADPLGNIVYANEPLGRLLGIPPAELVGRNSLEFVHEEDGQRVADEWLASQAAGETFAGVFRVRAGDGSTIWALSRSVPELDGAGRTIGFVSSLVDISERKQVEEDLSRRVAERTAQLVRANKELEAFCYSVSHDLRAPLRSIDGFCRLMAEDLGASLTSASREHLDRVLAASSRMDHLIDDFLTLSRASLGALKRSEVDLSDLARRVVDELRQREPERPLRVEIASGLAAHGDPVLLRDVLDNLLGNAFKFTARAAEACIEFFATTTSEGERAFVVRDNGAGFDMQQSAKLFTAFHRLHSDVEFAGTGVGLATVERIVQRHGGRVWAEASPGRGATFLFTLPAA